MHFVSNLKIPMCLQIFDTALKWEHLNSDPSNCVLYIWAPKDNLIPGNSGRQSQMARVRDREAEAQYKPSKVTCRDVSLSPDWIKVRDYTLFRFIMQQYVLFTPEIKWLCVWVVPVWLGSRRSWLVHCCVVWWGKLSWGKQRDGFSKILKTLSWLIVTSVCLIG